MDEIAYTTNKMKALTDDAYIELIGQLCATSDSVNILLTNICSILTMIQNDSKSARKAQKSAKRLKTYLLPFSLARKRISKKDLVLDCALFDKRPFQYGPACAVAAQTHKRCLAYFPLGSGKTLSALHAARTFLEMYPHGRVLVITTLSNVSTTWKDNIDLYLKHVPDKHKRIQRATVTNADWWFSKRNGLAQHYNRLLHLLTYDPSNRLQSLVQMSPKELKRMIPQFQGLLPKKSKEDSRRALLREWKIFKKHADKRSMLEATTPKGPFFLIVDECQEYVNLSAKTLLVQRLANAAKHTLFMSATPISDSQTQYRGFKTLLNQSVRESILWTNNASEKPAISNLAMKQVPMSNEEWRQHQIAASSCGEANAYLSKSRQTCNNISKWECMATRLDEDIARLKQRGGPIRMVVYSYFLKHGSQGFISYLKRRHSARSNGPLVEYEKHRVLVQVSLMRQDSLAWFNDASDTCKILILTSRSGTGISLKNVRVIHLMEPQWTATEEQQAIGRCTRKGSHDLVRKNVDVVRWIALPPLSKPGRSADQKVHKRMTVKKKYTQTYLEKIQKSGNARLHHLLCEFDRNQIKGRCQSI
jgi:hypothetical protein